MAAELGILTQFSLVLKIIVFRGVVPCSLVDIYQECAASVMFLCMVNEAAGSNRTSIFLF